MPWEDQYSASYIQITASLESITYLCVNVPKKLQETIGRVVKEFPEHASQPLFIDTLIMEEVLTSYRTAIDKYRHQLREIVRGNQRFLSYMGLN